MGRHDPFPSRCGEDTDRFGTRRESLIAGTRITTVRTTRATVADPVITMIGPHLAQPSSASPMARMPKTNANRRNMNAP